MNASKKKISRDYKQTEIGTIPVDWNMKNLGDVCGKITTGKLNANAMVEGGEYRFYTCAEEYYRIDRFAFDTEALLVSGNGANVGYIHYYKGKFNAYQRTYVLSDFEADIQYIRLFLERNLKERIRVEVNAGNTPYITMGTLTQMRLAIPALIAEQIAIAIALSDIAALIEKLEALLEKKKNIKQATMQELLTGKRRLPGFSGEWEKKKLEEVVEINMGQSPGSVSYNITEQGLPLIQGNADIENRKSIKRVWTTQITKTCSAGDLIMTVRAPVGLVGVASYDSCLGRGVCSFRAKNIDKTFLYHGLIFNENTWKVLEQGSTFTAANSDQIKAFALVVPPTRSEQAAIATLLCDMDTEIDQLESQLLKYQNLKQGMMQVLLTGKIRLI